MKSVSQRSKSKKAETKGMMFQVGIGVMSLFVVIAIGVSAASNWQGPSGPPTNVSGLDSVMDLSDFVSTVKLEIQNLLGPVYVRNAVDAYNDDHPVRLGLDASSVITTVDGGPGKNSLGRESSIAIGQDGLPVIAYNDITGNALKVMKCGLPDCSDTSGSVTGNVITTLDSGPSIGRYPSIAIGADGNPVIAYYDGSVNELQFIKCTSADCSTNSGVKELDGPAVGKHPYIHVPSDGMPIISYYDDPFKLRVLKCNTEDCRIGGSGNCYLSGGTGNCASNIGSGASGGESHSSIAIRPGAGNLPIVAFARASGGPKLNIVNCGNEACQSGNSEFTSSEAVDSASNISIAIATDGNAIVAYSFTNEVKVAHCASDPCNSFSAAPVTITTSGFHPTMAVGADGNPIITYYDPTTQDLKVVKCLNTDCTSRSSVITIDDGGSRTADIGLEPAVAIGRDGFPVISYRNDTNPAPDELRVAHCGDDACALTGHSDPIQLNGTVFAKELGVVIGNDGLPVISYYGSGDKVHIIKCTVVDCSDLDPWPLGNNINSSASVGDTGGHTSITIGSDGNPIAVHREETGSIAYVRAIHCLDPDCLATEEFDIDDNSDDGGDDAQFGRFADIASSPIDGLPIIIYYTGDSGSDAILAAHCSTVNCSGVDSITEIDSKSNPDYTARSVSDIGAESSLTIGGDGLPIIAYLVGSPDGFRVAHCENPKCTSRTLSPEYSDDFGVWDAQREITIVTNPFDNNYPIIAYVQNEDSDAVVVHCTDTTCSNLNDVTDLTVLVSGPAHDDNRYTSITIGTDGLPIVSVHHDVGNDGNGDLYIIHCGDVACADTAKHTLTIVEGRDEDGFRDPGLDSQIVIGSDGLPLIAFADDQARDGIYVVHCNNTKCTPEFSRQVGALGIAQANTTAGFLPHFQIDTRYGVMGYTDTPGGYGIYAASDFGGGATGRVDTDGHNAGTFFGPVSISNDGTGAIEGSLDVEDHIVANAGFVSNSFIAISAAVPGNKEALKAITTGVGATGAGIRGSATTADGIAVHVYDESQAAGGLSRGGTPSFSYGVYGYSPTGIGVHGKADAPLTATTGYGVYGESYDYGVYGVGSFDIDSITTGVGIFACGTNQAAEFNDHVRVNGTLNMGLASEVYNGSPATSKEVTPNVTLTEDNLKDISTNQGVGLLAPP